MQFFLKVKSFWFIPCACHLPTILFQYRTSGFASPPRSYYFSELTDFVGSPILWEILQHPVN